ncbi:hypothetical protein M3Y96_00630200 [Aphelenchoides besseyi]|nr:hypothetical protein M3Y96_00630200 [Aphelenchoides besseyi]
MISVVWNTFIPLLIGPCVAFAFLIVGCMKKPTPATGPLKPDEKISGDPKQKGYKPGHLPEFADPEEKDTDTFYGVKSALAFPVKNPDGTLQNNSPDVQSQQKIQKIADAKGPAPNTQAAAVPVNL